MGAGVGVWVGVDVCVWGGGVCGGEGAYCCHAVVLLVQGLLLLSS